MTAEDRERFALEESIRMEVHKQYRRSQWGRFFKYLFMVIIVLPLVSIILLVLVSTVLHSPRKDSSIKYTSQQEQAKVKHR